MNLDKYFVKAELIPAIIQEESTGEILMLAYMNKESMAKTLETGYTWFWSRSRQELWNKGATSGNLQKVVNISYDCDGDSLLVQVEQTGVACHTGEYSCFHNLLWKRDNLPVPEMEGIPGVLSELYRVIQEKRENGGEKSYTKYLFTSGQDKILKKVGEECTEVIIAGKADDKKETVYEIADLAYHVMVLMVQMGISVEDIHRELASRHIIDHKVKQEKMTK